jgi:hypothetical protein
MLVFFFKKKKESSYLSITYPQIIVFASVWLVIPIEQGPQTH